MCIADFQVQLTTESDLPFIFEMFEEAISFQKTRNHTGWGSYDKEFLKKEVDQRQQYKIVIDGDIAVIFSVFYSDRYFWKELDCNNALYLHRTIVQHKFRGQKLFQKVIDWAVRKAREKNLRFVRMDTWADNKKLIDYYNTFGFVFVRTHTTPDNTELPQAIRNLRVCLFQKRVSPDD